MKYEQCNIIGVWNAKGMPHLHSHHSKLTISLLQRCMLYVVCCMLYVLNMTHLLSMPHAHCASLVVVTTTLVTNRSIL
jgi:hypothetical protein